MISMFLYVHFSNYTHDFFIVKKVVIVTQIVILFPENIPKYLLL